MSKAKFATAKELIAAKKYAEAHKILKTIDHPTAREWEAKLDQLDQFVVPTDAQLKPSKKKAKPAAKGANRRIYNGVRGCLVVGVVLIILMALGSPKTAAPNPTTTSRPDVRPTVTEAQAAAIVPTQAEVVNRSGFVTVTPAPGTVYPTATITDTPTNTAAPSETPIPQITPVSSSLYDAIGTANARSCPDSSCEKIGQYQTGDVISVVGIVSGENYKGSPVWVQAIFHDGQTVYVHSSLVTPHVENAQPVQPVSPVVRSAPDQQSFTCPKNCTDAVAMGLSAEQAATCPGLDRDHDGQACYGN